MASNSRKNIKFQSSGNFTGIRLTEPSSYAAGFTGVKVALQHTFKEMGISRAMKTLGHMNQTEGFDCPGCAWPDPEKPSKIAEYCENGAKALAEEATTHTLDNAFFSNYSIQEISTWSDYKIGKSGRLIAPMILKPESNHYEEITWLEAYRIIADHLHALESPDEAIFYTSGRSSNEAAFLYGLFARAFGTNNMPDCSNMCHESSGVALTETLGIGKGSVKLEDFEEAEVVLVIGQNPGTNHPRMLSALEKCKSKGGKIISINPLQEAGLIRFRNPQQVSGMLGSGVELTDVYLQVKINQDVALLKLIQKKLSTLDQVDQQVFDRDFIAEYTEGYEKLMRDLDQYTEQELLERCGVAESKIDQAVNLLAHPKKIIICWAMGLTQHKNGVDNIKECVNLLLLKGSLGKPGAGTCPVRGHSNVQGDRSVGIMHFVSAELNKAIKNTFGFDAPEKPGVDVVHAIPAMHSGKAKVFIGLGGNFVSAASDTEYTAAALQACDLTVQISTKLNRSHLVTGKTALILPTLGRSEKDLKNGAQRHFTVENSMGIVHQSKGFLEPISDKVKSEPEIIGDLAGTFFRGNHPVDWKKLGNDYDLLREKLGEVISQFKDINTKSKGSGFYLPNNVRDLDFSKLPNQKAQFSVTPLPNHELREHEFLLMSIRSHDQFNTTIYGLDDRYRGIHNERRVLFMNPEDMQLLALKKMEVVNISSFYDSQERKVFNFLVIPYQIPKGNLAAYFPETNPLVPIHEFAEKSNTPISKSIRVSVEKAV
ncbi:FdhF/YdeP family oxidoreductase [Algoriphagus halophytocola]|uniref:FdhF/YdeP family oxidoreductase n=1 Tax=Algoriphagus halophytocola TaxID=2991499 RepID=A0ABY6MHY3_9BACT|nr:MULTISPECIES: FdhF/YdeP family oxidoreductase [unclassified Algoriphagus]UZD22589.1 FdhF/YdeP family oxidoreductase [Algoriphagus sp. TR-M5]WBL43855.1 FdhF/YdeP family oxidoreductase [Algoriphagus sp. TR-M9]